MIFKRNKLVFILGAIVVLVFAGLFMGKYFLPDINEDSAELRRDRFNYSMMKNITILLNQYKKKTGNLPSSEDGLAVVYKVIDIANVRDSWGREFYYSLEPNGADYKLWTYGRDGRQEGEGEDKDSYLRYQ